jgi:hypothetical protein
MRPAKEFLRAQKDNLPSAINQKKALHQGGEPKNLKRTRPDEVPQIN